MLKIGSLRATKIEEKEEEGCPKQDVDRKAGITGSQNCEAKEDETA